MILATFIDITGLTGQANIFIICKSEGDDSTIVKSERAI